MIAVAVVGIVLGFGIILHRRSQEFEERADDYHRLRTSLEEGIGLFDPTYYDRIGPEGIKRLQRLKAARDRWREQMEIKYREAARRPWLPVEPDPPPPPDIP